MSALQMGRILGAHEISMHRKRATAVYRFEFCHQDELGATAVHRKWKHAQIFEGRHHCLALLRSYLSPSLLRCGVSAGSHHGLESCLSLHLSHSLSVGGGLPAVGLRTTGLIACKDAVDYWSSARRTAADHARCLEEWGAQLESALQTDPPSKLGKLHPATPKRFQLEPQMTNLRRATPEWVAQRGEKLDLRGLF